MQFGTWFFAFVIGSVCLNTGWSIAQVWAKTEGKRTLQARR